MNNPLSFPKQNKKLNVHCWQMQSAYIPFINPNKTRDKTIQIILIKLALSSISISSLNYSQVQESIMLAKQLFLVTLALASSSAYASNSSVIFKNRDVHKSKTFTFTGYLWLFDWPLCDSPWGWKTSRLHQTNSVDWPWCLLILWYSFRWRHWRRTQICSSKTSRPTQWWKGED